MIQLLFLESSYFGRFLGGLWLSFFREPSCLDRVNDSEVETSSVLEPLTMLMTCQLSMVGSSWMSCGRMHQLLLILL